MNYEQMAECIELRKKGVSWGNLSCIYGVSTKVLQVQCINSLIYGVEYFENERLKQAADKKMRFLRRLGFSLVPLYELQAMHGVLSPDELVFGLESKSTGGKQQNKKQSKGVKRERRNRKSVHSSDLGFYLSNVFGRRIRHSVEIERIINDIDGLLRMEKGECTSD